MPIRYTTDYADLNGSRFRCYVDFGSMGWVAYILDLRPLPLRLFGDFVEDPVAGKVMLEEALPRFLEREDLPNQPLTWNESAIEAEASLVSS